VTINFEPQDNVCRYISFVNCSVRQCSFNDVIILHQLLYDTLHASAVYAMAISSIRLSVLSSFSHIMHCIEHTRNIFVV